MKPTWKNTLQNKTDMDITTLANSCFNLGYEFMVYDGFVYTVYFEHPVVAWADTEFTSNDVK